MKKPFSVNDLLSVTSLQAGQEDTAAEETPRRPILKVVPINIDDLVPSKDNFYSVENIAELKILIEMFGVLQNLVVKPIAGGKYKIIAGERRYRACKALVAEGKTEFQYAPCGLQTDKDEIKERIALIITNSTARELTDWEKMKQAEELTSHYTALKKRDNLPGRVRDLVAEALNMSATNIARLNAINKNLAPELVGEFKAGRLGLSAAYELSGLPEDAQREALAELQDKGGLSINDAKERKQEATPTDAAPPESLTQTQPQEVRDGFMESMGRQPEPPPAAPKEPPEYQPKEYPQTPADFEEGQEETEDAPENKDFVDMTPAEKAETAIVFLNSKRFTLFPPGEDTRVLDFIIDTLVDIAAGMEG